MPDLQKICQDISPDFKPVADHKPYDLSAPDGIALYNSAGPVVSVQNSVIIGGVDSIDSDANVEIAGSEIDGPLAGAGVLSCQAAYNGVHADLNAGCQ